MKKRLSSFIIISLTLALSACVTPYLEGDVRILLVETRQAVYPLNYHFFPSQELTVTMFDSLGEKRKVPVKDVTVNFPANFTIPGEKKGSVTYQGKTAMFTVVVYDPEQGPPPAPDGPVIVLE